MNSKLATVATVVLIAGATIPAYANTVFDAAYQAAQNNYKGDAKTYLEQHDVSPTGSNENLYNQFLKALS